MSIAVSGPPAKPLEIPAASKENLDGSIDRSLQCKKEIKICTPPFAHIQ